MADVNLSALWARVIVEEATRAGVRHWCVSPGSRSTPLTLAVASDEALEVTNHIDERAAAFFALGQARMSGQPVGLICTSGTAVAHYLPAVIEASMSNLPLVVCSADRPVELMQCGSPQTIHQHPMFGEHARVNLHTGVPEASSARLRHLRQQVSRAVQAAAGAGLGAPGPVQINVPFREPLEPTPSEVPEVADLLALHGRLGRPYVSLHCVRSAQWSKEQLEAWQKVLETPKGVVVCGPLERTARGEGFATCVREFAAKLGWPLLADPLSGARFGEASEHLIERFDAILRARRWAKSHAPEVVLSFGAQPTSKVFRFWQEDHPEAVHLLVNEHLDYVAPAQTVDHIIQSNPEDWIEAMTQQMNLQKESALAPASGEWLASWQAAQQVATEMMDQEVKQHTAAWEGGVAASLVNMLRPGDLLHVASSMPVRDLDAYGTGRPQVLEVTSNRGANGIDGLVATALGQSYGRAPGSTWLLIGDVALMHDVGSLLHAHRLEACSLVVVVINNGGGAIFEYLPIAKHPEHFATHFLTPHSLSMKDVAQAAGARYIGVSESAEFEAEVATLIGGEESRLTLLEVFVDREENVRTHRKVWETVAARLDQEVTS